MSKAEETLVKIAIDSDQLSSAEKRRIYNQYMISNYTSDDIKEDLKGRAGILAANTAVGAGTGAITGLLLGSPAKPSVVPGAILGAGVGGFLGLTRGTQESKIRERLKADRAGFKFDRYGRISKLPDNI